MSAALETVRPSGRLCVSRSTTRPLARCSDTISAASSRLEVLVEDVVDHQRRPGRAGTEAAGARRCRPCPPCGDRSVAARKASLIRRAPEAMQPAPMQRRICLCPAAARSALVRQIVSRRAESSWALAILVMSGLPGTVAACMGTVAACMAALPLAWASSPLVVWASSPQAGVPSRYWSRILASLAGLTCWWTSSSIMITGARPQAPKQRPTSKREQAVGGRLADLDPQRRLERGQHLLAAADVAGRAQADADQVLAARNGGEEGIEADHAGHFAIGLVQRQGDLLQGRLRQIAEHRLGRSATRGSAPRRPPGTPPTPRRAGPGVPLPWPLGRECPLPDG